MNQTLHVVAHLTAHPDTVDALRSLLSGLLEPTRREVGCLRYTLLQNQNDPADFTFVEEWTDAAALDAHLATPHLQAALSLALPLLAAAPDIRRYSYLG